MFITILGIMADIIGYAFSAVILALVGKFVFDLVVNCLSIIWETIHKPSYDRFIDKRKAKKLEKKLVDLKKKKEGVKEDA
jgi:uncharacterized membrane protein (DUF106 family)